MLREFNRYNIIVKIISLVIVLSFILSGISIDLLASADICKERRQCLQPPIITDTDSPAGSNVPDAFKEYQKKISRGAVEPPKINNHLNGEKDLRDRLTKFINERGPKPILWISDMDDTFTIRHERVSDDVLDVIIDFVKQGNYFGVNTGSNYNNCTRQFIEPLIERLKQRKAEKFKKRKSKVMDGYDIKEKSYIEDETYILDNILIAVSNGTEFYRFDIYDYSNPKLVPAHTVRMNELIGDGNYRRVMNIVKRCINEMNIRQMVKDTMGWNKSKGDFIEERGAQITLYVVGRDASGDEKEAFVLKGGRQIRQRYADYINRAIMEDESLKALERRGMKISAKVQGSTAVELLVEGYDKSYGADVISDREGFYPEEVIYSGDDFRVSDSPLLNFHSLNINVGEDVVQDPGTINFSLEGEEVVKDKNARRLKNTRSFKRALEICSEISYASKIERQRNDYFSRKDPREEFFVNSIQAAEPNDLIFALSFDRPKDIERYDRARLVKRLCSLLERGCAVAILDNDKLISDIQKGYKYTENLRVRRGFKGMKILYDKKIHLPDKLSTAVSFYDSSEPLNLKRISRSLGCNITRKFIFFWGSPTYGLPDENIVLKRQGIFGVQEVLELADGILEKRHVEKSVTRKSITITLPERLVISELPDLSCMQKITDPRKWEREEFVPKDAQPLEDGDYVNFGKIDSLLGRDVSADDIPYVWAVGAGGQSSRSDNMVLADFAFAIPKIDNLRRYFLEWKAGIFKGIKKYDLDHGNLRRLIVMYSYFGRSKIAELLKYNFNFNLDEKELSSIEQGNSIHIVPQEKYLDGYYRDRKINDPNMTESEKNSLRRGIDYEVFSSSRLLKKPTGDFVLNPTGHWDFIRYLILTGMIDLLLKEGVRYAVYSNLNNVSFVPETKLVALLDQKRKEAKKGGTDAPVFLAEFIESEGESGTVPVVTIDEKGNRHIQLVKDVFLEEATKQNPRRKFKYHHTGNFIFSFEGLVERVLGISLDELRDCSYEERVRRLLERQPMPHVNAKEVRCSSLKGEPMTLVGLQSERNIEDISRIAPGIFVRSPRTRLVAMKRLEDFSDNDKILTSAKAIKPKFSSPRHIFSHNADSITYLHRNDSGELVVAKEANGPGADKLKREIQWLLDVGRDKKLAEHFPEVKNFEVGANTARMELVMLGDRMTIAEALLLGRDLNEFDVSYLIKRVTDFIFGDLASEDTKAQALDDHFNRTQLGRIEYRLKRVWAKKAPGLSRLIRQKELLINGIRCRNVSDILDEIKTRPDILKKLKPPYLYRMHGDFHLGNVLILPGSREFSFVDPRGDSEEDPVYDLAKLCHSIYGRYDFLDREMFTLDEITEKNLLSVNLYFREGSRQISAYNRLIPVLHKVLLDYCLSDKAKDDAYWLERMAFIHAAHFISMAPLHLHNPPDDYQARAMYCTGVILLNMFIDMIKSGKGEYFGFNVKAINKKNKNGQLRRFRDKLNEKIARINEAGRIAANDDVSFFAKVMSTALNDKIYKMIVLYALEDGLLKCSQPEARVVIIDFIAKIIGFDINRIFICNVLRDDLYRSAAEFIENNRTDIIKILEDKDDKKSISQAIRGLVIKYTKSFLLREDIKRIMEQFPQRFKMEDAQALMEIKIKKIAEEAKGIYQKKTIIINKESLLLHPVDLVISEYKKKRGNMQEQRLIRLILLSMLKDMRKVIINFSARLVSKLQGNTPVGDEGYIIDINEYISIAEEFFDKGLNSDLIDRMVCCQQKIRASKNELGATTEGDEKYALDILQMLGYLKEAFMSNGRQDFKHNFLKAIAHHMWILEGRPKRGKAIEHWQKAGRIYSTFEASDPDEHRQELEELGVSDLFTDYKTRYIQLNHYFQAKEVIRQLADDFYMEPSEWISEDYRRSKASVQEALLDKPSAKTSVDNLETEEFLRGLPKTGQLPPFGIGAARNGELGDGLWQSLQLEIPEKEGGIYTWGKDFGETPFILNPEESQITASGGLGRDLIKSIVRVGMGSGVIFKVAYDKEEGNMCYYILTAFHLIDHLANDENGYKVPIYLYDGTECLATIERKFEMLPTKQEVEDLYRFGTDITDARIDIACLRVPADAIAPYTKYHLIPLSWGHGAKAKGRILYPEGKAYSIGYTRRTGPVRIFFGGYLYEDPCIPGSPLKLRPNSFYPMDAYDDISGSAILNEEGHLIGIFSGVDTDYFTASSIASINLVLAGLQTNEFTPKYTSVQINHVMPIVVRVSSELLRRDDFRAAIWTNLNSAKDEEWHEVSMQKLFADRPDDDRFVGFLVPKKRGRFAYTIKFITNEGESWAGKTGDDGFITVEFEKEYIESFGKLSDALKRLKCKKEVIDKVLDALSTTPNPRENANLLIDLVETFYRKDVGKWTVESIISSIIKMEDINDIAKRLIRFTKILIKSHVKGEKIGEIVSVLLNDSAPKEAINLFRNLTYLITPKDEEVFYVEGFLTGLPNFPDRNKMIRSFILLARGLKKTGIKETYIKEVLSALMYAEYPKAKADELRKSKVGGLFVGIIKMLSKSNVDQDRIEMVVNKLASSDNVKIAAENFIKDDVIESFILLSKTLDKIDTRGLSSFNADWKLNQSFLSSVISAKDIKKVSDLFARIIQSLIDGQINSDIIIDIVIYLSGQITQIDNTFIAKDEAGIVEIINVMVKTIPNLPYVSQSQITDIVIALKETLEKLQKGNLINDTTRPIIMRLLNEISNNPRVDLRSGLIRQIADRLKETSAQESEYDRVDVGPGSASGSGGDEKFGDRQEERTEASPFSPFLSGDMDMEGFGGIAPVDMDDYSKMQKTIQAQL